MDNKEKIIYAYRLSSDTGDAPCIFNIKYEPTDLLTLACCKGGYIRSGKKVYTGLRHTIGKKYKAKIEEGLAQIFIMGIYKNKILYFAEVTKILEMKVYYSPNSEYVNRHDYIYKYSSNNFKRNEKNPGFHPKNDKAQHINDWLGVYALISNRFAYFGEEGKPIPEELLDILPKWRETKNWSLKSNEGQMIMDEIKKHWKNFNKNIKNLPTTICDIEQKKGC